MRIGASVLLGSAALLSGQTTINGSRSIQGDWDASGAASTKPARTGEALPSLCRSGEAFFLTTAPAGQNLYLCASDNVWSAAGGPTGDAARTGSSNVFGSGATQTFRGVVDASAATATLPVQTGAALPAACATGQLFLHSGSEPSRMLYTCSSTNTWTQVAYAQGSSLQRPAACQVGQIYFATDVAAGQNLFLCTAVNTWTQPVQAGIGGSGAANQLAFFTNAATLASDSKVTRDASGNLTASGNITGAMVGTPSGTYLTQWVVNANYRLVFGAVDNATCSAGAAALSANHSNHRVSLDNQSGCALTVPVGASTAQFATIILCNGGSTPTTALTWSGVKGGMAAGGTAGQCAAQSFVYDGVNNVWYATSGGSAWN